jgi:hypothetical protein
MLDLGYMAKRIVTRPDWLDTPNVHDICAVSGCISFDFCDYINFWKHNGYWFFNSPRDIQTLATANDVDLSDTTLFFYKAHDLQYDADSQSWMPFTAEDSFHTSITPPLDSQFLGFDIVTYSMQNMPECSPLSCNHLATEVTVNDHCLIATVDYAIDRLEAGLFDNSEPGPFRIISVNTLEFEQ